MGSKTSKCVMLFGILSKNNLQKNYLRCCYIASQGLLFFVLLSLCHLLSRQRSLVSGKWWRERKYRSKKKKIKKKWLFSETDYEHMRLFLLALDTLNWLFMFCHIRGNDMDLGATALLGSNGFPEELSEMVPSGRSANHRAISSLHLLPRLQAAFRRKTIQERWEIPSCSHTRGFIGESLKETGEHNGGILFEANRQNNQAQPWNVTYSGSAVVALGPHYSPKHRMVGACSWLIHPLGRGERGGEQSWERWTGK